VGVFGAALLVAMVVIGPVAPLVAGGGPSWRGQVAAARAHCRDDHGRRTLRTAPGPSWSVSVSCARLSGG
jgi:hypothetical protein